MKYSNKLLTLFLLAMYIIIILHKDAYAYLDPGTGSFIFQMALAALLAGLVTVKLWWKKLILMISRFFSKSEDLEKHDK